MFPMLTALICFMQGLIKMFNDTITVFNLNNGMWYSHVIRNTDAVGIIHGATNTAVNGTTKSDNAVVLINSTIDKHIQTDEGLLPYTAPKSYAALENGNNAITFQPQTDFIVLGEHYYNNPINDDDYETGFYDYINSTLDDVYLIVSAAFYGLIPHFEIGAR